MNPVNSCEGLPTDSVSTRNAYERVHEAFQSWARSNHPIFIDVIVEVDRLYVREFIRYYVSTRRHGTQTHLVEAIWYLQQKLVDHLGSTNRSARRGQIREDHRWLESFQR